MYYNTYNQKFAFEGSTFTKNKSFTISRKKNGKAKKT